MENEEFSKQQTTIDPKKMKGLNPFLLVIISFAVVILVGTILLYMPFSQKTGAFGDWDNVVDCFFTAVSATCVTGLCTFGNGIGDQLTLAGQIIVLVMIQTVIIGKIKTIRFTALCTSDDRDRT